MSRKLVVLTYDIRPDANSEEYERYVRSTDYPAFRARPSIHEYHGHKVVKNHLGNVGFSRFDLMFVDDFESLETDIFGDPDLKKHADGWIEKWGVMGGKEPHDSGRNYKLFFAEEVWG